MPGTKHNGPGACRTWESSEPGLYVRPAKGVPKKFWDIGIRIEDDALVTAKGCELMTRGVPVKAGEIEALMRE